MKSKFLIAFLLTGFSALFLAATTLAQAPTQGNYDVTVSPVFFDLKADPGTTLNEKIKIRNNTSSPIPIKMLVQKLTGDINGNLTLKDDAKDTALTWVSFEKDTVILAPLEWTEVPYTINIPDDAAFGYYLAISFKQDNNSEIKSSGATITGAAAVPILLNVRKEGAKSDAKLLQFTTDNFVNEYMPVNFKVKVENTGNIHIKPHGNIFISSGSSKDLAILEVNAGLGNILPQSSRTYEASWLDGFAVMEPVIVSGQPKLDKNGKPEMHLVLNWNKLTSFRVGKYDATLLLVFDNGTRDVPIEGKVSFWVFPYKILIVIVFGIVALILLARFALKKYIEREVKKRSQS